MATFIKAGDRIHSCTGKPNSLNLVAFKNILEIAPAEAFFKLVPKHNVNNNTMTGSINNAFLCEVFRLIP